MALINDIIEREFILSDYNQFFSGSEADMYKHVLYEDYWLVVNGGFCLDNQTAFYEAYVKSMEEDHPCVNKNTSVLFLYNTDKEQLSADEIVEIENDPFFFKKYVLQYNDKLCDSLIDYFKVNNARGISDMLMMSETFESLTTESDYGLFHFLYSIAHKLPFIPVRAEQKGLQKKEMFFSTPEVCDAFDEIQALPNDYNQMEESIRVLIDKYAETAND